MLLFHERCNATKYCSEICTLLRYKKVCSLHVRKFCLCILHFYSRRFNARRLTLLCRSVVNVLPRRFSLIKRRQNRKPVPKARSFPVCRVLQASTQQLTSRRNNYLRVYRKHPAYTISLH